MLLIKGNQTKAYSYRFGVCNGVCQLRRWRTLYEDMP